MISIAVLASFLCFGLSNANFRPPEKLYECDQVERTCQPLPPDTPIDGGVSLEICQLNCGPSGSLWPKPTGLLKIGQNTAPVHLDFILLEDFSYMDEMLEIFEVFKERWHRLYGKKDGVFQGSNLVVSVNVAEPFQRLNILKTNETYSLRVNSRVCNNLSSVVRAEIYANISAGSIFAARHALETLNQLIVYDSILQSLRIACDVEISDAPVFAYRGLMLDVSRNFYPLHNIEHLIDAMSYNKFNVLHLHLTDSQSFPVQIQKWPNMTFYGAYGPEKIYTTSDLEKLVKYARIRGITIVPEIDTPSHVANGWQWAEDAGFGEVLMCFDKKCIGNPCGLLNPTNNNTYRLLEDVYSEMLEIFGDKFDPGANFFHLGGDEVSFDCWNSSETVKKWLQEHGYQVGSSESLYKVWSYYEKRLIKSLSDENNDQKPWTVLWWSKLTEENRTSRYLSDHREKLIIEFWKYADVTKIQTLLKQNFSIIIANSDSWYLDCGVGSWIKEGGNWCPYKDWRTMYNNFISSWAIRESGQKSQVLGGEGCVWSESISAVNMDQRIWPRASAIAERLWSDPETCWYEANGRMMAHRSRMEANGVAADVLEPEWCSQNENICIPEPSNWKRYGISSTCPEFSQVNGEQMTTSAQLKQQNSAASTQKFHEKCAYLILCLAVLFHIIASLNHY